MSASNVQESRLTAAGPYLLSLAIAIGCVIYFDFISGLLAGLLLCSALLALFRQGKVWRRIVMLYGICLLILLLACALDIKLGGPYAQWYNHRLEKLALDARLIGGEEGAIKSVLGRSTYEYTSWTSTDIETGEPAEGAELRTTYKFSPYPIFSTVQGFEVHCNDGKVTSIELFDD